MSSLPWGINRLGSMIAPRGIEAGLPDGRWVRAVPEPYYTIGMERIRAAWWVLTGRAHAVVWPEPGDLEQALNLNLPSPPPTPTP